MNRRSLCLALTTTLAMGLLVTPAHAQERPAASTDPSASSGTEFHTGWTPTASDTCSVQAHEKYAVTGPDGRTYDGWHPPTATDPATGTGCTFGHEHGDDPRTSRIYDWTVRHLGGKADGLPFGLAGQASMEGAEHGSGLPHRHEDHVGYKVSVRNEVKQVRADRTGYLRDAAGKAVTCDYLMMVHQGSHSPDALRNNAHELLYSVRCTDGIEMVLDLLTTFGDPNQYQSVCDDRTVRTSGSELPNGTGGARRIPDTVCAMKTVQNGPRSSSEAWGLYERWEADAQLSTPEGRVLARADPWFGVRNPSRIGDGGSAVPTTSLAGVQTTGWPWEGVSPTLAQYAVTSPFNGAQRDAYVQHSELHNDAGATTWYTDAYGKNATHEHFPGAVRQYLAAVDTTGRAEAERRIFGTSMDYGARGTGVHAPN